MIGKDWLDQQSINWRDNKEPSKKSFRFGNDMIQKSLGKITLALKPRNDQRHQERNKDPSPRLFLEADVVDCRIPCLISRPALESMEGKIDFKTNEITTPTLG